MGTEKRIIVYCRESRDENFEHYERIETQRDMLVDFCMRKKLGTIVDIIIDDNVSGTGFSRFEAAKSKIDAGEIDIFVCKDASRLGRNLLESLHFVEYLDRSGVELIFESEAYDEDIFPIVAWFNERRAKEDSRKIRRVLRHKMTSGQLVIKAPFGYVKRGASIFPIEPAASIVREAFELFGREGLSMIEIAEKFSRRAYVNPSGGTEWNRQHAERILKHIAYSGDMAYGMREKKSFKSKQYIYKKTEDWIIVKNHHEAIVPAELFELVRKRLESKPRSPRRKAKASVFAGKIFCGKCGNALIQRRGRRAFICAPCGKYASEEQLAAEMLRIARLALTSGERRALKLKAMAVYDDRLAGRLPDFLFDAKIKELDGEINALGRELELEISAAIVDAMLEKAFVFGAEEYKGEPSMDEAFAKELAAGGGIVLVLSFDAAMLG